MVDIHEVEKELTEKYIPTGWDIFEWAGENPDTTIAHALKRTEKIFDTASAIYSGFSLGKDSTLSAELSSLELLRRRDRVSREIKRDGSAGIDPYDAKWAHHLLPEGEMKDELTKLFGTRPRKIVLSSMDAEWVYSAGVRHGYEFMETYGPEGYDTVDLFWFCLILGWQNGTSFSDARLNSWDPELEHMWIRPKPTTADLHGFEVTDNQHLNNANIVRADQVGEFARKFHGEKNNIFQVKGVDSISNFGFGSLENDVTGTFMTLPGLDEDFFQEYFSKFFAESACVLYGFDSIDQLNKYSLPRAETDVWEMKPHEYEGRYSIPTSLVSLRASESFDRRTILLQAEYSTGQYSRSNGTNTCSQVFDLSTADVWRLFAATDWGVSEIYNDMYEAGIPIEKQRTGSLLNYAATRNISDVKALEPDMYARITARFSNVEFFSQFSKAGYYKIQKPKDMSWDGRNHIKAGMLDPEIEEIDQVYKDLLDHLNISYTFFNHVFKDMKINLDGYELAPEIEDSAYYKSMEKGGFKAIRPLKELKKLTGLSLVELSRGEESRFTDDLDVIHTTWRDYGLHLLNTSNPQALEASREKVVTSITSWKFGTGSAPETTYSALKVLAQAPDDLEDELLDQHWHFDNFAIKGRTNISGKYKLSLGVYPMESLEKMAATVLEYLIDRKDEAVLREIEEFMDLSKLWSRTGGDTLTSLEVSKAFFADKDWKVEILERYEKPGEPLEEFTPAWYKAMKKAISVWFKEDIHSTSSWKRIAVAILKGSGGVPDWQYIGFAPTFKERIARAEALQAFSTTHEEKMKAAAEAKKLEKVQA